MASHEADLVIIGAGPAGLAAAVSAYDAGCRNLMVLERDNSPGGILQQCIHNGFGLHYFREELTGPEYASRFIAEAKERKIDIFCNTMVTELTQDQDGAHIITAVNPEQGLILIKARSVILAMGCRERPRGAIGIPGSRCAGIMTTGTAQRLVNREGLMPGRRIVILGSGDIGLIMARRMTYEGAEVLACVEIMPYSSGLTRNVVQCLQDYDIPLMLSHTVIDIEGRDRLNAVTIAAVDPHCKKPIPGSEKRMECDTLLLSVGLIPENELSRQLNVEIDGVTQGPRVDQDMNTGVPGVFACGNVLHVHDLVDHVSIEAERAGRAAWSYIRSIGSKIKEDTKESVQVKNGRGVRGLVPQVLRQGFCQDELTLSFRPDAIYRKAQIVVSFAGKQLLKQRKQIMTPGEMAAIVIRPEHWQKAGLEPARISSLLNDHGNGQSCHELTVSIED